MMKLNEINSCSALAYYAFVCSYVTTFVEIHFNLCHFQFSFVVSNFKHNNLIDAIPINCVFGYKFEILNFLLLYPTILLIPCQSKKIEVFNITSFS